MNEYIKIALQADPVQMIQGFSQAEGALNKFGSAFQSTAKIVQAGSAMIDRAEKTIKHAGMALTAAGTGGLLTLAGDVKAAMDFQTQLKNVQSLTQASQGSMNQQGDAILAMSRRMPQSAVELASGLYDVASSGFQGAEGLQILDAASVAASAGLTKSAVATKAIVAALNAYGLEAKDAADISDILFQGVNVGVLTFEDMASGMGQWVGMAAAVGVSAEQATTAIATMTLAGIQSDEAATYLSRIMEAFIQPKEAMTQAAQKMGYASAKQMLDNKGLGESMKMLDQYTQHLAETTGVDAASAFNDLFGTIQGARGAMAMISNDGKNWDRAAESIIDKNTRAGATSRVFATQSESLSMKMEELKNSVKAFGIEIGSTFLKPVGWLVTGLTAVINVVNSLPKAFSGALAWVKLLGSAITFVVGLIATLAPGMILKWAVLKLGDFGLARLALQGEFAAKAISKLHYGIEGVRKLTIGNGINNLVGQFAKMGALKFGLAAGAWAAIIAAVVALVKLKENMDKATESGKALTSSFAKELKTDTFVNMKDSINSVDEELVKVQRRLDIMTGGTGEISFLGGVEAFLGIDGGQAMAIKEQQARVSSLEDLQDEYKEKMDSYKAVVEAAWISFSGATVNTTYGAASDKGVDIIPKGSTYTGGKDAVEALFDNMNLEDTFKRKFETLPAAAQEALQYQFGKIAAAKGINLETLVGDPKKAKAAVEEVVAGMQDLAGASAYTEEAKISFMEIAASADEGATAVDKLGDALGAVVDQVLGPEAARDALEGLVNQTYKDIEEIKGRGNLEVAQDFTSNNDDALKLRSDFREITQAMIEDTVAWAKAQGEVTATDLNAYILESVSRIQTYGKEMGLADETTQHYVGMLQQVVANGDINIAFKDNLPESTGRLQLYLQTIGKTSDREFVTQIEVQYRTPGVNFHDWLASQGFTEEQIGVTIMLTAQGAWTELNGYVEALHAVDSLKLIDAVIQLKVASAEQGKPVNPADIEALAKEQGVGVQEINQVFNLVGDGPALLANAKLVKDELDKAKPTEVKVTADSASQKVINDITRLHQMPNTKNITVNVTEMWTTGNRPTTPADGDNSKTPNTGAGYSGGAGVSVFPLLGQNTGNGFSPDTKGGRNGGIWGMFAGGGLSANTSRLVRAVSKAVPGTSVSSGYRAGSRTSSGNVSLHASGHAADLVGNKGAIFNYLRRRIRNARIQELIYQHTIIKRGKQGHWARNDHFDHVHAGTYADGGIADPLVDSDVEDDPKYSRPDGKKYADGGMPKMEQPGTADIYGPMPEFRIFAEPETGGEAYIPMAPAKRARSMAIWTEVGRQFGQFASGRITESPWTRAQESLSDRTNQDIIPPDDEADTSADDIAEDAADDAEKAAKDAEQAAKDAEQARKDARQYVRSVVDYKIEVEGSATNIDKIAILMAQMQEVPAYSEEWMELGKEIKNVSDEMKSTGYAAQDAFLEMGVIDNAQYLKMLEGRFADVREYTKDWWSLGVEVYQQKRKIIEERRGLEEAFFSSGNMSSSMRIGQLQTRLGEEKAWSKEWLEIQNDIVNEEKTLTERRYKFGAISTKEYVASLRTRLTTAQEFSTNWAEIMETLNNIESTALKNTADIFSKFNDKMVVSTKSVVSWLNHQVKVAEKFGSVMEALKATGKYSPSVIQGLLGMGPQGVGLAGALLGATGTGQADAIVQLIQKAIDLGMINHATFDAGGYLAPGYTLAYNGTGRPEPVGGGGGGITVNLPNAQITSPNDANRLGDRVSFGINSARI